ncbi:MAG: hypothetical protein ABJM26_20615 [Anderseniella sp.]
MAEKQKQKNGEQAGSVAMPLGSNRRVTSTELDDDLIVFFKLMIAGHKPV